MDLPFVNVLCVQTSTQRSAGPLNPLAEVACPPTRWGPNLLKPHFDSATLWLSAAHTRTPMHLVRLRNKMAVAVMALVMALVMVGGGDSSCAGVGANAGVG